MQQHEQWSRRWSLAELKSAELAKTYLIASPSVRACVKNEIGSPLISSADAVPSDAETLIVAGGGSLIDQVKVFHRNNWPALRLIAIPSIWGSGAEVSPVAVLTGATKDIHFSDDLIPDQYVVWPELAQSAPVELVRHACGDVWAHALEAFCSPLASPEIRAQAAALMNEIADFPLAYDPRWFDASASACLLQARSSVGLIHGFAHALEPKLKMASPKTDWGHAKLCSIFLLPVLRFNLSRSPKVQNLATEFGLDLERTQKVAESLFEPDAYTAAMTEAEHSWEAIARDRCSRTNCILVRRDSLEFFQQFRRTGVGA